MTVDYVERRYGRASAEREAAGRVVLEDWLTALDLYPRWITGKRNITDGDMDTLLGEVELKTQSIGRYPENFVDLLHLSGTDQEGLAVLGRTLGIPAAVLEPVPWRDAEGYTGRLDRGTKTECQIGHLPRVRWWAYVNPETPLIWVYEPDELLGLVHEALMREALRLDLGECPKGTFGVLVAPPALRVRKVDGVWRPA